MSDVTANIVEELVEANVVEDRVVARLGECLPTVGACLTALATGTQSAASATEAYAITYDSVPVSKKISLVDGSKIKVQDAGEYNTQFSIQFENTDTKINSVGVWVRVNGADYPYTNSYISIPEKHGGISGKSIMTVNFTGPLNAGDEVELYWHSPGNGYVHIQTVPAGTLPTRPAAPAVILTIRRIMP